jgi:Rrf2 family protein
MFGRTADYALRALLLLARERQSGFYLRADEIADATGAPRNYTSKVLGELARAGFIASSRGPTGGFRLLRPANQITIGAVIDRFDSPVNNPRCLNGNGPCNPKQPCAAHQRWKAVLKAQREPLDRTTIEDLVDRRVASPLLARAAAGTS